MPVQGKTLKFIQDAHSELTPGLGKALIGSTYDAAKYYALSGCNDTGAGGGAVTIQSGIVLYNNTLYRLTGGSFTLVGANVTIINLTTAYLSGVDPVTFSDLNTYNVHKDEYFAVTQGASGSGTLNHSALVFISNKVDLTSALAVPNKFTAAGDANFGTPRAILDNDRVYLYGAAFAKTGTVAGDYICQLPAGMRPSNYRRLSCHVVTGTTGTTTTHCWLGIDTSGNIQVEIFDTGYTANSSYVFFNGISFLL